jgi:hypothetical protein
MIELHPFVLGGLMGGAAVLGFYWGTYFGIRGAAAEIRKLRHQCDLIWKG